MRHSSIILTAIAGILGFSAPAMAYPHHGHHHHRHSSGFFVYSSPAYSPVYTYPSYYEPYYYAPAPAYAPAQPPPAPIALAPSASSSGDRYCREYQLPAKIGNKRQSTYGTACLQPDGTWQIIN